MRAIDNVALIRVAAYPAGLDLPAWPDLATGRPDQWIQWLTAVWTLPGYGAAIEATAPDLARQITRAAVGDPVSPRQMRRLTETAMRYLLRWTTRATPFGLWAGIAPIQCGANAEFQWGGAHTELARPTGQAITEYATHAEWDLDKLRGTLVMTNSLGFRRGHIWVLPCARTERERRWDVELHLTEPTATAIGIARTPVLFGELAAKIGNPDRIGPAEVMLAGLVRAGVLLTGLRPRTTVTDPAEHLGIQLEPGGSVDRDLRADVRVTLPSAVIAEAEKAASALTAVAPYLPGWAEYHDAFIARWGPGAAVPLREVLAVLGFPAGFRSSARRDTTPFTSRDRLLTQLAQRSIVDGGQIVLDDDLIARINAGDSRAPVPHTELRFTLAAPTLRELDRGAFTLTVVSGSRHAGVAAGRFLPLLTPTELAQVRRAYQTLPTAIPGAVPVQLASPPLDDRLAGVARTPELLPILPVGDFHHDPQWTVDDLAVTGDGARLWLVSQSTGQTVEPMLFNSVLLATLQHPLTRFLAEIWTAWSAPCTKFDWGHASHMPFLPRIVRGRSILHSARWILTPAELPPHKTPWPVWRDAWQRHRDRYDIPQGVLAGTGDIQLRLDLANNAHLALLRSEIDKRPTTVITEAPGPSGWSDGRPAEILLTLAHPQSTQVPPREHRHVLSIAHRPGRSPWIELHLTGRTDDILTALAQRSGLLPSQWWFVRYHQPEPHLRLRIHTGFEATTAEITSRLASWAQHLEDQHQAHDFTLHTYRPETRHGSGITLTAAEAVFVADSHAAIRRLDGDRHATTAAGMIAIADAFTNGQGMTWLTTHIPRRTGPRLDQTQLDRARVPLHDQRLHTTLITYRQLAEQDALDLDLVLADLLHLHHARMIGVDPLSEQHCARLARTIAYNSIQRVPQ
ncbi:hypothetical protein Rhe02_81360 [Rhizocola hellebori]|uniref:Lantibiotic dehydratase n=1 Tax=Rhizocola hellebori TaxID=1392758 RepID=A0A8J3QI09_9ACTN|nr:lantibiotic dehydratase [Rhizocola hellebori]GIH10069.1 hypothetical protein Rhe02_81360 [Rhizocola hellebori]